MQKLINPNFMNKLKGLFISAGKIEIYPTEIAKKVDVWWLLPKETISLPLFPST